MARVMTIAIALSAVACDNPFSASGPEGLDEARQHWVEKGISSYTLTVSQDCFCVEEARGPFRVVVRNGAVVSVTDPATGAPRTASEFVPLTVEELFARIEEAMAAGTRELEVEYDRDLGYPVEIVINRSGIPVDAGMVITVLEFVRQ
jgi:hypothetical protein